MHRGPRTNQQLQVRTAGHGEFPARHADILSCKIMCVAGRMKVQRCAAAWASVSVDSVCATRPVLDACTDRTASATTFPASGSEESFVEVSTQCNPLSGGEESADTMGGVFDLWNVNERITR